MLFLATRPAERLPESWFEHQDKLLHFGLYFVLVFAAARAMLHFFPQLKFRKVILLASFFCLAYAAFEENLQAFVPGREVEWADFVANAFGVLVGNIAFFYYARWKRLPH